MTDDKPPRPNNRPPDHAKRGQVRQLFALCEDWLAGQLTDEAFTRETVKLQRKLLNEDWDESILQGKNHLFNELNLAVQCVIAVEQTKGDLKMLARTKSPPLAVRAFYFGRHASDSGILALETSLRADELSAASPRRSFNMDFDPQP